MIGKTLGHYAILDKLGAGGMGEVYRAHDERLDRDVALKVLPAGLLADESARHRFRKEALALAKLNHPNIEAVHDFDTQAGVDFLVMEYVPGVTLSDKLALGPLSEKELIRYGEQLAEGLAAAHAQGIVHRDLKPGNLRIALDERLKILDFGLAKLVRPVTDQDVTASLMETKAVAGTLPYMAPEQLRGEPVDTRTDLYAAGVVLYEMATARRPFEHQLATALAEEIQHKPAPPPGRLKTDLSVRLEEIILKCLEKEPENRYQSAKELSVDLRRLAAPTSEISPRREPRVLGGWWRWAAVAVVAVAALAVASWFYFRPAAALKERDTVVLADFVNSTGEAVFDDTLTQALAIQLEQSPFLNVLSEAKVSSTLKLMRRARDERITRDMAREICLRTGSKALLAGSIARLGSSYAITLRAANCQTDDSLASIEVDADSREHVLRSLGTAVSNLRGRLGESLASLQRFDKPLEEVTTSSLEALQAFTTSRRLQREKGDVAALPYAKRAVELDPNFARAHSGLAIVYGNLGQRSLAREHRNRAYELRDRVSEHERFYIEAAYYGGVGETEKSIQVFTQWIQAYPADPTPHQNVAVAYDSLQDFERAIAEIQEALRLAPDSGPLYSLLMYCNMELNRLEEAKAAFREAQARKLEHPDLHLQAYRLSFLQQDAAGMQQELAWGRGRPGVEDRLLAAHADAEAYYGRYRSSRQFTRQAAELASRSDANERAARHYLNAALREAALGNAAQTRELVSRGLQFSALPEAALPLALIGDSTEARKWIAAGNQTYPPTDRGWRQTVSVADANLDLQRGNAKDALAHVEGLPAPPLTFSVSVRRVRGEALLRLGQGEAAAQEYSDIIAHRSQVLTGNFSVLVPLAYLGLGRARAVSGDTAGARQAYEQFLEIWKNADSDIPIYQQAKAEYAKLK